MKDRILEIVVLMCLLILIALTVSGCAMFKGQKSESPVFTEPPTPGVQLWQAAKKSNWLVTISILGIAGGVFATMSGASKLGIAASISSSISLFMALAVARFALWMAVFGLIGSIAAAVFSILVRRKALVEIIKGVQRFKNGRILNGATLEGELAEQAKTTQVIVGNIKNELKLKGRL